MSIAVNSFTKDDVLFYIENKNIVIAVTDEADEALFGFQIYPKMGTTWMSSLKDVEDAYSKGIVDFTKDCSLLD